MADPRTELPDPMELVRYSCSCNCGWHSPTVVIQAGAIDLVDLALITAHNIGTHGAAASSPRVRTVGPAGPLTPSRWHGDHDPNARRHELVPSGSNALGDDPGPHTSVERPRRGVLD